MKRLNAKKIAAVVSGAALLGFGLAFASPITYGNVPIINNAGQPVVEVVVGHGAQPMDAVSAGNIAAAIGNLAWTQTMKVFPANVTEAQQVLSVAVSPSQYTLANKQVTLNVTSTSLIAGTYSFSALIGSILNRGVNLGSPINTKALSTNYGYQDILSTVVSPMASAYTAAGSVPASSVTATYNGGGVSFTSFTTGGYDNILQVTSANLPSLLNNYGGFGENEYVWLTGFPVYDQASGVQSLALLSAGGAYQVTFNKPIAIKTSTGGINNANFWMLGQSWSIVNAIAPTGTVSTSNVLQGGTLQLASSLTNLTTVYVGGNLTSGPFRLQLSGIGNIGQSGTGSAAINIYYQNSTRPLNTSVLAAYTLTKFNVSGHLVYVGVNQTFSGGSFAYQQFAKLRLYANTFNVTNGQVYNKTYNPGWYANILWTNGTGSGNPNMLQSIILYNSSPTTLLQGQSFNFVQSPAAYKLTFIGRTLSSVNFDQVTATVSAPGSVTYQNAVQGSAPIGLRSISNITEPAQYLTVTSGIPNAFSFGGQTGSAVVYDLAPYKLVETANSVSSGNTLSGNVVITLTGNSYATNLINANIPLTVIVSGAQTSTGAIIQSLATAVFQSSSALTNVTATAGIYNVTAVKLSRAIPGLTVKVSTTDTYTSSNTFATLTPIAPQILYSQTGKTYLLNTSGASVIYNQQNGQPTSTFGLSFSVPNAGTGIQKFGTYSISEYAVPQQTSETDSLAFGIYNSTAGTVANPMFQLNQSSTGTRNNMTYTSTQSVALQAPKGFITERGSSVGNINPQSVTLNLAEAVDALQFALGPSNTLAVSHASKQYTFGLGQQVVIPGLTSNVTVGAITATVKAQSNSTMFPIAGIANVTAGPVAVQTPVLLKSLSTTAPLVVLDSAANPSDSLVLVGSGYVNTLSKQLQNALNMTNDRLNVNGGQIVASGNQVLVAGWTADQTLNASNRFINALYTSAAGS